MVFHVCHTDSVLSLVVFEGRWCERVHHRLDPLCEEQFPVLYLARVPNEHRNRQLLWRTRNREQFQTCLMRQTVGLALVHLLGRPDEVLPGVLASTRAGHNVVQAALVRVQYAAGVLASIAITLADSLGAQLRALL